MGVVLAGGAGRRLGRGKAGLRLPGRPREEPGQTLVEWAASRLAAVNGVEEVLVAAGNAFIGSISTGTDVPVSATTDGPGSGPAAGVLGAARAQPERTLLVLACDLPLVPVELLDALAASRADLAAAAEDIADPWTMNLTCALWTPPALKVLARRVARGDFRLYPMTRCSLLTVEPVDAGQFGEPGHVLLNVNTADDWERARRLFDLTGL